MTCQPIGDMRAWPMVTARCVCGATLHPKAADKDWIYVDDSGELYRDDRPPLYRDDPAAFWAKLAAEDIGAYATLSAAVNLTPLYFWHMHHPVPAKRNPDGTWQRDPRIGDRVPPMCCEQPMYFSPFGWTCRVSGWSFNAS